MATIELTEENFDSTLTGNDIVIVDFWASWGGPCRTFAPVFEAASEQHSDIAFAKVNTEKQEGLAASFHIRSIPTLMIFRESVVLYAEAGALPATALEDLITQARNVDMQQVHADIAVQAK